MPPPQRPFNQNQMAKLQEDANFHRRWYHKINRLLNQLPESEQIPMPDFPYTGESMRNFIQRIRPRIIRHRIRRLVVPLLFLVLACLFFSYINPLLLCSYRASLDRTRKRHCFTMNFFILI